MEYTEVSTLKQAALEYAAKGIAIIPLNENEKTPKIKAWGEKATIDLTVINEWWDKWPQANIGMVTGSINGILVLDVDIKEGKNGQETLQELENTYGALPETRRHNTPSGGYHLLYNIGSLVVRGSAGKIGAGLDIRCDGGYIVAPPSVIDGRCYEVVNPDVEIADTPEWLVKLATEQKTAVKAETEVTKGERNNHIFKTAMECKKQGMGYEEAVQVVAEANSRCNPPLEQAEVDRTLASAYKYQVDSTQPEILELNKKHAVIMVGGKCRVLNEVTCPIFDRSDITLSTPTDFFNRYANRMKDGKPIGEMWFKHSDRREYEDIVFSPGKETPKHYNLWRGFAVEPKEGDCSLYLKHIEENISSGNKEIFNYIVAWMADAVQNLDSLVGTSIVLKGKQGAGKGKFVTEFGRLFGPHFTHINQSSHLTGKFNSHMKNTYILFADEACWGGDKQAEGPLKALITEPTIMVEGKGQDPYTIKNHVHVMVSSNNDWVVPLGAEDRRFFVVEVGDKHLQDSGYFKAITDQMNNGGREALLHYLMNYDLTGIDLRKFPKTEALFEMKLLSASPVQKFWYEKLTAGALDTKLDDWNNGVVLAETLQEDYSTFAGNTGVRHKSTSTELGSQLKKLVPTGQLHKSREMMFGVRKPVYKFPSLHECREYFEQLMNQKIEWPEESVALKDNDNR